MIQALLYQMQHWALFPPTNVNNLLLCWVHNCIKPWLPLQNCKSWESLQSQIFLVNILSHLPFLIIWFISILGYLTLVLHIRCALPYTYLKPLFLHRILMSLYQMVTLFLSLELSLLSCLMVLLLIMFYICLNFNSIFFTLVLSPNFTTTTLSF